MRDPTVLALVYVDTESSTVDFVVVEKSKLKFSDASIEVVLPSDTSTLPLSK